MLNNVEKCVVGLGDKVCFAKRKFRTFL